MKNSSLNSIKEELKTVIEAYLQENDLDINSEEERDEAREQLTGLGYYINGYYQAEQWLERHNVTAWEAVSFVQEWERENFGECKEYNNAESTANMIAFILGYEAMYFM